MLKKLSIILLILISCGTEQCDTFSKKYEVPKQFEIYVKLFEKEANLHERSLVIDNLIMEFVEDYGSDKDTIGQCTLYMVNDKVLRPPKVTFKKDYWEKASKLEQELLVFHELGHCVLFKDHNDDTFFDEHFNSHIPVSIMSSYIMWEAYYKYYRETYLQELFSRSEYELTTLPLAPDFIIRYE